MSLYDNSFRNSCAKLLIFPLSCKFSRRNIVKINRKCGSFMLIQEPLKVIKLWGY